MLETVPFALELKSVKAWRRDICQAIAERATLRHFRRHETLFALDTPPTTVYAVKSGLIEISGLSRAGHEITESLRGPGDIFGYSEIMLRELRHRQATVLQDAEIWCLARDGFLDILQHRPGVVVAMLGSSLHRVARLHQMRADLRGSTARYRIGYVISRLAASSGSECDGPNTVRVTHEEIGRLCSLSRQTVTSELGALRAANVLRLGSRSIEVPSLAALERHLEELEDEQMHTTGHSGALVGGILA
jgi:CRP-like cAMP-binding protein